MDQRAGRAEAPEDEGHERVGGLDRAQALIEADDEEGEEPADRELRDARRVGPVVTFLHEERERHRVRERGYGDED